MDHPPLPQSYKVHVDASYDGITKLGKIAWAVYINNKLASSNVTTHVRRTSIQSLEALAFKTVNFIYEGAKIYTDSAAVWEEWKGKNKNRIYLIDHNDNLAHDILHDKSLPKQYIKVPTYKFEYVKVKDDDTKTI